MTRFGNSNFFTVSFFGHRYIDDMIFVEQKLEDIIKGFIRVFYYVNFLVGRNGDFDQLVSSSIISSKKQTCSQNCCHIWVLPYQTSDLTANQMYYNAYYDSIEVCPISAHAYYKQAINLRNRWMIDQSDAVICYVKNRGGAFNAMKYAMKQGKNVLNISDMLENHN